MTENEILENNVLTDEQKRKKDKDVFRLIVLLCVVGVIFITLCIGSVFLFSQSIKRSEEYSVAYEYLVGSGEFLSLGASEEDVRLTNYWIKTSAGEGDATFMFDVDGAVFTIVCHLAGGEWCVCEECTYMGECADHHETEQAF